ncbi:MAG: molybdopterin-binding/glycosyltransferase family 2 protein [Amylibacter sp.]|nr:molybdopterin-binding/glycosyltransferase family 2 protein [Amylibacter sp.]
MKFASVELAKAKGHILAHSMPHKSGVLKKGITLGADDLEKLRLAGQAHVTVAMLEQGDVAENKAAQTLADSFTSIGIKATQAVAGRVNLIAEHDGVLSLNTTKVEAFNAVDEAITIATLPNFTRVKNGTLLATLKIIPYGVAKMRIDRALDCIGQSCIKLHGFTPKTCDIILTKTQGFKPSLLTKAEKVIRTRIGPLNLQVKNCSVVDHSTQAICDTLQTSKSDMVLILGASATSDRQDVVPEGIVQAGGVIKRFGMPVDPGNLLVLGTYQDRPVIGLPGCARAPALNGADWVLERLCAGLPLEATDIARMGVGGLLKEIPDRIQPRMQPHKTRAGITAILLAAGSSSRMRGDDKLMRKVGNAPLLRHCVKVALSANIDHCIVVLKEGAAEHKAALQGLPVKIVETPDAGLGMSASLRAGILAMDTTPKAILVGLADMPDLTSDHFNKIIAGHDTGKNRFIICPTNPNGKRGHPVLFDAKFTENLANLQGDTGAKDILKTVPEWVYEIPSDAAVSLDLDTPEAWDAWVLSQAPNR